MTSMPCRPRALRALGRLAISCVILGPLAAWSAPGDTTLLSTTASGAGTDGFVQGISPDGRYVLIQTSSADMVPDGNPPGLVRLDRLTDTRVLVVALGTSQASISADGRYVAFTASEALVPADTNGEQDVYVRDMETATFTRASVGPGGVQSNGWSEAAGISANGRYVTFDSEATNLVPNDTNGDSDIFVRDLQARVTERVSVDSAERQVDGISQSPTINADGRFVVFDSTAAALVADDTNRESDVFVRDRLLGTTERISVASDGRQGDGVSYVSWSPGAVSDDGRYVAFLSGSKNLAPGDTSGAWQVYVRDRQAGLTERVSVSTGGATGTAMSFLGNVSNDGRHVSFISGSPNLVPGDLNGRVDMFVRDRAAKSTVRVTVSSEGVQSNGDTWEPAFLTRDGQQAYFSNTGTNLVDVATPAERSKAYVHELGSASSSRPFVVDPKLFDFGDATIAFGEVGHLVFTNTGNAPLTITGLQMLGTNAALFEPGHDCGTSVAVGDACDIHVTFRPSSVGPKSATLTVYTPSASQDVTVRGNGVLAQFALSKSSIPFGLQAVGTRSPQQSVQVRNTGRTTLPLRWIAIVGTAAGDFGRKRWCPPSLEPGRVCNIPVWFAPTSAGDKTARLVVSPGPSGKPKFVAVSGTGL